VEGVGALTARRGRLWVAPPSIGNGGGDDGCGDACGDGARRRRLWVAPTLIGRGGGDYVVLVVAVASEQQLSSMSPS